MHRGAGNQVDFWKCILYFVVFAKGPEEVVALRN
jgi:hypothetical protein